MIYPSIQNYAFHFFFFTKKKNPCLCSVGFILLGLRGQIRNLNRKSSIRRKDPSLTAHACPLSFSLCRAVLCSPLIVAVVLISSIVDFLYLFRGFFAIFEIILLSKFFPATQLVWCFQCQPFQSRNPMCIVVCRFNKKA